MNQIAPIIRLSDFMEGREGWGRDQGRTVFQKLLSFVDANPQADLFQISLEGIERMDFSFISESAVELARRFRGIKGFFITHFPNEDLKDNWAAACERKQQPLIAWDGDTYHVLGPEPSQGTASALKFALRRGVAHAADFARTAQTSVANASTKYKQLWQQGYLLRREQIAPSGGIEYAYFRMGA